MKIEKSELKYLALSYIFIIALAIVSGVKSINQYISNLPSLYQFLILNLGLYLIFFFLIKGFSLGMGRKNLFRGALGSILAFMSLDLLFPEFHLETSGELIKGGIFGMSATDYFFATLWQSLGATGFLLWILVYAVTFTILFISGAYLIDNFIKNQI